MKIILNNIIPFKGFIAMNLFGILFVRKEYAWMLEIEDYKKEVINHESIHTEQMKDFGFILPGFLKLLIGGLIFYILYLLFWLVNVLFVYPFSEKAYRNICFEKEAYMYEDDLNYLQRRKHFAFFHLK